MIYHLTSRGSRNIRDRQLFHLKSQHNFIYLCKVKCMQQLVTESELLIVCNVIIYSITLFYIFFVCAFGNYNLCFVIESQTSH